MLRNVVVLEAGGEININIFIYIFISIFIYIYVLRKVFDTYILTYIYMLSRAIVWSIFLQCKLQNPALNYNLTKTQLAWWVARTTCQTSTSC